MRSIKSIVGIVLYGLSFCIPRQKNKWVFGSLIGFSNNSKFFLCYVNKYQKERCCYWIGNKKTVEDARRNDIKAYERWSLRGMWHCLTAGVYVYDSYASDINVYCSGGAFKVNLWHGVGIKNIEHKISAGPLSKILHTKNWWIKMKHLPHFIKPDVFLSTSALMTEHFSVCFELNKERIVESCYPRCEVFSWEKDYLSDFICRFGNEASISLLKRIKSVSYTCLYMPTWRDSGGDLFVKAGMDFGRLNKVLCRKNRLLIVKLHPVDHQSLGVGEYSNIVFVDPSIDIYPFFALTDCLITDYSSVYYDYILMDEKSVILFPFDYDDYIHNNRDLAFDYNQYTAGIKADNFEELLELLGNDLPKNSQTTSIIKKLFWEKEESMEELYGKLCSKLAG